MRVLACLSLLLLGACRPALPGPGPEPEPTAVREPVVEPEGVPAVRVEAAAASATEVPAGCRLVLPAAPGPAAVAGAAFVLVDGVGVLRIADGAAGVVLALPDNLASGTEMVVGTHGELWLSDWAGVQVLQADGALVRKRKVRGGPRYEHMVVRSGSDVWAVTSDSEWELVHHDGKRWTSVRRRAQFPGTYDDNKVNALAVDGEGVWISSWNGLWRGVGGHWQQVALAGTVGSGVELLTYRDRVIVGARDGYHRREGEGWRALAWPDQSVRWVLGENGVMAASDRHSPTMRLRVFEGDACTVTSEPVRGGGIDRFVVDAVGRTWVSSDHALAVIDMQGRLLAQWSAGELPGLTGRVLAIAVDGAGPVRLPAARAARTRELRGRLTIYKNSKPLAGLEIELCSGFAPGDTCPEAPFTPFQLRTRTDASGGFRFVGVPDGTFSLLVRPPEALEDCQTPFTVNGALLEPARDCAAATGDVCDLGVIEQCQPFEMPPPH